MVRATLTKPHLTAARVPLLPVEVVLDAYQHDAYRQPQAFARIIDAALQVAAPSLMDAVRDAARRDAQPSERIAEKLLAYLIRMSARPTPFGLFAGVGLIELGDRTTLALDERSRRIRARPDMAWLVETIRGALDAPSARLGALRLRTSDLLMEQGGRLFGFQQEVATDTHRTPFLSLRITPALSVIRSFAARWRSFDELVAELQRTRAMEPAQAAGIVQTLWKAGVLVDDLTPSFTSAGIAQDAVAALADVAPAAAAAIAERDAALQEIGRRFAAGTLSADDVRDAQGATGAPAEQRAALQIDMTQTFSGTLNRRVLKEVERYGGYTVRSAGRFVATGLRDTLRISFEGEHRVVPFLAFADAALDRGTDAFRSDFEDPNAEIRHAVLTALLARSIHGTGLEVEPDADELARLCPLDAGVLHRFAPTFELGFRIQARSASAVDRGEYLIWPGGFHASDRAGTSLARFGDMLELDVAGANRRADGRGSLTAELVFFPLDARNLNVASHPPYESHEIQIGLYREPEGTVRISPADLWVGARDDGSLYVWSAVLRREVDVVENHAFITRKFGSFCARLLSTISLDGVTMPRSIDWGALALMPFLPRIRDRKVVLSRARWRFVPPRGADAQTWANALRTFAAAWRMPRWLLFADDDRQVLLDLTSAVSLRMAYALAKEKPAVFEETWAPDEEWLTGEAGRYVAEFVASFTAESSGSDHERGPVRALHGPLNASRVPAGTQWFYAQVFCSNHRFDTLLRAFVAPLLETLELAPDRPWFFVRYSTTESHLRFRMQIAGERERELLAGALDRWTHDGVIRKWAICAYERELERYGGLEGITVAEEVFRISSDEALAAVLARTVDDPQTRDEAAAAFLRELFVPAVEADERGWIDAFRPAGSRRKLDERQRNLLARLRAGDVGSPQTAERLRAAMQKLVVLAREGRLTAPLRDVVSALGHMHCNRLGLERDSESRTLAVLWHDVYGRMQSSASGHLGKEGRMPS